MTKSCLGAIAAFAAILALAPPAFGQLRDENLLTALPDGFKVGMQTRQGDMIMMEFIPERETVEDWSTMVTVQIFKGLDGIDPDLLPADLAKSWTSGCAHSKAERLGDGAANQYSFSLWSYDCPLNVHSGKPESMWLKSISGADALYLVQVAFRQTASTAPKTWALGYLDKVSVCDTRRSDRACPPGM
jgi:hypothetical protein